MNIGIDFGTTNTVAAFVNSSGAVQVLPLDDSNPDSMTMRTLIYAERDGTFHFGADATHTHRIQNLGRVPRFSKQWIGFLDMDISEFTAKGYDIKGGTTIVDLFSDVDVDAPGRLLHSLKSPLATDYAGTNLFGAYYSLESLIGLLLGRLRQRIEVLTGEPVQRAVFGRPVNFASASGATANDRAQARLAQAAELAGFRDVEFEMEPIAAGLSTLHETPAGSIVNTLVFDFGGGTLDIAIMCSKQGEGSRVLATGGVGIAGDHFDQVVFKRALRKWFGEGVKWGPQRLDFPVKLMDALGDWQEIPSLCTEQTLLFLREAQRDCSSPIRLMALEDLIARGHAYDVYAEAERTKVALSTNPFSIAQYQGDAIDIWQPVWRTDFDGWISRERRIIGKLIDDTLANAGLAANEIDQVVRTGGSSSIPTFVAMLGEKFGRDRVVERDLFTAVAAGLALRAAQIKTRAHV